MKLNLTTFFTARYWTLLMSVLLLALVSACGGGNGSAGSPVGSSSTGTGGTGTTSSSGTISLALTNSAGSTANTIPTGSYLTATANVVDANGAAVANTVVTFSVSNAAGTITPALGTAITDSSGNAKVTLQSGSASGAGTITASATVVGTTAITATQAFSSVAAASSGTPSISLNLVTSAGCTANTVSSSCPLTVNATVTDGTGAAASNVLVTFSTTASLTSLNPSAGTSLTNSSGVATTSLVPASLETALQQTGASGQVSASATVNGVTVISTAYYTMGNTSISLALVSPASGSADVNAYGTSIISVSVSSNGSLYTAQPVTVNFSSGCQLAGTATLASTASTVNGIATVTYTAGQGCSGNDTVTASVLGSSTPVSVALNVAAPAASNINFVSANPASEAIVLPGAGGNGRTSTAILTFKVVDSNGNGIQNATVSFTNAYPTIATLTTSSGSTDSNGEVSATVDALAVGNFRITATLASDPSITTISDTVLVSTGVPVQSSMTAGPETPGSTFNFGGWNTVATETLVVYLADANGNPVADGTPVTATTDSGAVGTSSAGGCTTVDGQCTVPFVSQLPHLTSGIATVTFTTTDNAGDTLSTDVGLILSTNDVYFYTPDATTANLWDLGGTTITNTSCTGNAVVLLTDSNGNPLAATTPITAATTQAGVGIGTLIPAAIPDQAPHTKSATSTATDVFKTGASSYVQGTLITIPLTITAGSGTLACNATSGTPGAGSAVFNLTVTPANGVAQLYTITLKYPA